MCDIKNKILESCTTVIILDIFIKKIKIQVYQKICQKIIYVMQI